MSLEISGILVNPMGTPITNATITFTALSNDVTLKSLTASSTTDKDGLYNLKIEIGNYSVSVNANGRTVTYGSIFIDNNSTPASLNYLLKQAGMESGLTVDLIVQFREVQSYVNSKLSEIKSYSKIASDASKSALDSKSNAENNANISTAAKNQSEQYCNEVREHSDNAANSAIAANNAANNAQSSASSAKISENNARQSQEKASLSEANAAASKQAAVISESNTLNYRNSANQSATAVATAERNIVELEKKANQSQINAANSAIAANQSEQQARQLVEQLPVKSVNGMTGNINIRNEYPVYRLSKNQAGLVDNGFLVGFSKNPVFSINISTYKEIYSGIEWSKRDAEEKEILTAMGMSQMLHFQPSPIRVLKMNWSGCNPQVSSYTIYQGFQIAATKTTIASYAKLVSGKINGSWLNNVTNKWELCGQHFNSASGNYIYFHAYAESEFGEVLFIWPGVVAGLVDLDRNKSFWSFYPYIGDQKND